jgi:TRAP-type C4-dicarboxylate transport system permease small subunit
MQILLTIAAILHRVNDVVLAVGRWIGVAALAIMVCLILGQVFFRYVLNDAPNWTEEAARFCMLWMTGLLAPLAMRRGGFVSIDMLERALPRVVSALLSLTLLGLIFLVLLVAWDKGLNNHVDSLTGRGKSASLRLPLDWFGGERMKFRNWWMFSSLFVGVNLLILVTAELIIRQLIALIGGGKGLRPIDTGQALGPS